MRVTDTKRDSALVLEGIKFDVVRNEQGGIQSLRMEDAKGNIVLVTKAESYSNTINVQVKAPPKLVKRWHLKGVVAGLHVDHLFDDEYTATKAKSEYEAKVRREDDAALTVEAVEVPEDE